MHEGQPKALYSNGKLIISPTYFHSLSDKRCCTLYVFARGGTSSALLTVYANKVLIFYAIDPLRDSGS